MLSKMFGTMRLSTQANFIQAQSIQVANRLEKAPRMPTVSAMPSAQVAPVAA